MSARPRRTPSPRASEAAEQLGEVFFEVLMRHKSWFSEAVSGLGVSPIQARALLCIEGNRPLAMSEVAGELGCGPSNVTGVIDKLEARDLVKRREQRSDRRIKTVAMTRKGAALRGRLVERVARPAPWMTALSKADQRALTAILRRALRLAGD